jgi:hypothetical protein
VNRRESSSSSRSLQEYEGYDNYAEQFKPRYLIYYFLRELF